MQGQRPQHVRAWMCQSMCACREIQAEWQGCRKGFIEDDGLVKHLGAFLEGWG